MKQLRTKVVMILAVTWLYAIPVAPLALVGCTGGCSTVAEGSETFVVRAEQTYKNLDKSFRAFTTFEHNNRGVLRRLSPGIERAANTVRTDGFDALESLQQAVVNYKASRTAENRDAITKWLDKLAIVEQLMIDYQTKATLTP